MIATRAEYAATTAEVSACTQLRCEAGVERRGREERRLVGQALYCAFTGISATRTHFSPERGRSKPPLRPARHERRVRFPRGDTVEKQWDQHFQVPPIGRSQQYSNCRSADRCARKTVERTALQHNRIEESCGGRQRTIWVQSWHLLLSLRAKRDQQAESNRSWARYVRGVHASPISSGRRPEAHGLPSVHRDPPVTASGPELRGSVRSHSRRQSTKRPQARHESATTYCAISLEY